MHKSDHDIDSERNARQTWSHEHLSELKTLIAAGVPVREIAERMGRSEYAVRSKASQAKISLKPAETPFAPRRPR
jgi:hypothetical protein